MTTLYKVTGSQGDDSVTVRAHDSVTVVSWWGKPDVRIDQRAVWIERGNGTGTPVVHTAEGQS